MLIQVLLILSIPMRYVFLNPYDFVTTGLLHLTLEMVYTKNC